MSATLAKLRTLIGGLATGHRSRPRLTTDADFVVSVPQIELPAMLDDLIQHGFTIDQRLVIAQHVQQGITCFEYYGLRIDWLRPVLPLYQHAIDRASLEDFMGHMTKIASAESQILLKLIASRPQDQADICSLLASNRDQLDLDYIESEWKTIFPLDEPRWLAYQKFIDDYYKI